MLEVTAMLGNLGNFVGAIGVVGSLIYLVFCNVNHVKLCQVSFLQGAMHGEPFSTVGTWHGRS